MPVPPWLCVGVSLRIGNIEKVITLWDVRAFKSKNWTSVEYTTWNSIFTNFFLCFWIFLELFFIYSKIVWQTDFNVSRIFNRVFSNCFLAFQQQKCHCPPFSWWQIMADYVANSLLDKGRKNEPAFFFSTFGSFVFHCSVWRSKTSSTLTPLSLLCLWHHAQI